MLFLARQDGLSTVVNIAAHENMPRKFSGTDSVSAENHELVIGQRGLTGDCSLARSAEKIPFADILRCIDGPLALAPCASQRAFSPCAHRKYIETCEIGPALLAGAFWAQTTRRACRLVWPSNETGKSTLCRQGLDA